MNPETTPKKRRPIKRIIAFSLITILVIAGVFVYNNFNRLLSDALMRSFESNIASDVYELKFENLRVNLFEGSIRVFNVSLLPRETPLKTYPYINSSFRLKTERITLMNVQIWVLLKSSKLELERISIRQPEIELMLDGNIHVLLPFEDSTKVAPQAEAPKKKFIDSFVLDEFQLVDASIHVKNSNEQREFNIQKFNISLHNLMINQKPGEDLFALKQVDLAIGEFAGNMKKGPIKQVSFKDYKIGIDSLQIQKTLDTLVFHFNDFRTGLKAMDIQTADGFFQITLAAFDLSYKEKTIRLSDFSFKANVSDAVIQKKYTYQHTQFSGSVGTISMSQVNFDGLIYQRKIFIDEIVLDKVIASVFKDKTKPIDKSHLPVYLGQTIRAIPLPLLIKRVKATNVNLVNVERKPDSSYAKANIRRGTAEIKNITNLSSAGGLSLNANAYLEDKAHFKLNLDFSYQKPQFSFEGGIEKFELSDLNPLIQAYTPAKINKGVVDEIAFSGIAENTNSTGTLKFLYHELEIDLELKKKTKWMSSVIAFAANTALHSSNPGSSKLPPRLVQFHAERDMNKGFINLIIKSMLNGLKETMILSKENRKAYREEKKKLKKERKQ